MKLGRIPTLLAGALLALALAAPAAAGAAEWKHEGAPLEKHGDIDLLGSEIFISEAGAMICEVDQTLTAIPGSSGEITNAEATKCQGLFGELAPCELVETKVEGQLHVTATDLTATVTMRRVFDSECPIQEMHSTLPELTTTVPNPAAIEEVEYFGSGSASIDGGPEGEYEVIGSGFVTENAGTYGIG